MIRRHRRRQSEGQHRIDAQGLNRCDGIGRGGRSEDRGNDRAARSGLGRARGLGVGSQVEVEGGSGDAEIGDTDPGAAAGGIDGPERGDARVAHFDAPGRESGGAIAPLIAVGDQAEPGIAERDDRDGAHTRGLGASGAGGGSAPLVVDGGGRLAEAGRHLGADGPRDGGHHRVMVDGVVRGERDLAREG